MIIAHTFQRQCSDGELLVSVIISILSFVTRHISSVFSEIFSAFDSFAFSSFVKSLFMRSSVFAGVCQSVNRSRFDGFLK